jgi:hypothetical protein
MPSGGTALDCSFFGLSLFHKSAQRQGVRMRYPFHRPTSKPFLRRKILFLSLSLVCFAIGCLSCGRPWSRKDEHQILTRAIMNRYRINNSDLTKLQFYLSDPLVLEASDTNYDKEIPENEHKLYTNEHTTKNVLTFNNDLPGKCIELIPEHKIYPFFPQIRYHSVNINWEPMRLHINFDYDYLNYLIFTADEESGNFVLEYDKKQNSIQYGGRRYICQDGCGERLLLFDEVHTIVPPDSIRYTLPGNKFLSPQPKQDWWWLILVGLGLLLIMKNQ